MNEISKIAQNISVCNRNEVPKAVITLCKAITPQFYKNTSEEDLKAEYGSIRLLTDNIDLNTLAEMCQRAVKNYGTARALNPKTYFNINYIMEFYKESFNWVHCDSIEISKHAKKIAEKYDDRRQALIQKWKDGDKVVMIGYIQPKMEGRQYSPKDYYVLETDIEDVVL